MRTGRCPRFGASLAHQTSYPETKVSEVRAVYRALTVELDATVTLDASGVMGVRALLDTREMMARMERTDRKDLAASTDR